eukprot:1118231-Rhodomonas_salina.2
MPIFEHSFPNPLHKLNGRANQSALTFLDANLTGFTPPPSTIHTHPLLGQGDFCWAGGFLQA